jgi:hypothetical protein
MGEVAATKTPCTPQQLVTALASIWPLIVPNTPLTLACACVLTSQWAIETSEGASCICWNFGNQKWSGSGPFCQFSTKEIINGVEITIHPPTAGCQFVAYSSLQAGAQAWLTSLSRRWTLAWAAALAGDPAGFAQGLHTADPHTYAAGMLRYFNPFMTSLSLPAASAPPDPLADTSPGTDMPEAPETD